MYTLGTLQAHFTRVKAQIGINFSVIPIRSPSRLCVAERDSASQSLGEPHSFNPFTTFSFADCCEVDFARPNTATIRGCDVMQCSRNLISSELGELGRVGT